MPQAAHAPAADFGAAEGGQACGDDVKTGVLVACLVKLHCEPGRELLHGPALRGLVAMGHGETPAAGDAPTTMTPVKLESLLRGAGSALLDRAGQLKGQLERASVCAALEYLSFRCFCALGSLHQAVSGVGVEEVPGGDAVWGPILEAWGSVRAGADVEGALADLTRWWQSREAPSVDVAGVAVTPGQGAGDAAVDEALASMKEQAALLRGEAAGDLRSDAAAEHLESAVGAVEELRKLLVCSGAISGRKLTAAAGIDLAGSVACKSGKEASVYTAESSIVPDTGTNGSAVIEWAAAADLGASALARGIAAAKRSEAARKARGLPRVAQAAHGLSLTHNCAGSRPDEPLGVRSDVVVQAQCERGWPLGAFVDDEAWQDVGLEMKQRVCLKVLGACAVVEACGVEVGRLCLGSFVVVGVETGSVAALAEALDGFGVEVLLGACCGAWDAGSGASGAVGVGADVASVLHAVLGTTEAGSASAEQGLASHSEVGEHALSSTLGALAEGGSTCCMAAYAQACEVCCGSAASLLETDRAVVDYFNRLNATLAATPAGQPRDEFFVQVCRDGDVEKVKLLLSFTGDEAVDVHASDEDGPEAAFRAACEKGHLDVVRELLSLTGSRAVDVHAEDRSGLEAGFRAACTWGRADIVRELLSLGGDRAVNVHARDDHTTEAGFTAACTNGHLDVVRELLSLSGSRTVDVHARDRQGSDAGFRLACYNGHAAVVHELLGLTGRRTVNVHAKGPAGASYGFRWACTNGHVAVVRELLSLEGERALNVHARDFDGPEAGFRMACRNGHADVVHELLSLTGDQTVDVHAKDADGPEAGFRMACKNGHADVVHGLLTLTGDRAINVHVGDEYGPEAGFRLACAGGHVDVVRELLALTGAQRVPVRLRQRARKFPSLEGMLD